MSDPAQITEYRLNKLEEATASIADSLQTLTRLEVRHQETREALDRAFQEIRANKHEYEESCDAVEDRLHGVELQLPLLNLTSGWVIGGTLTVVAAVFGTCGLVLWVVIPIIYSGG